MTINNSSSHIFFCAVKQKMVQTPYHLKNRKGKNVNAISWDEIWKYSVYPKRGGIRSSDWKGWRTDCTPRAGTWRIIAISAIFHGYSKRILWLTIGGRAIIYFLVYCCTRQSQHAMAVMSFSMQTQSCIAIFMWTCRTYFLTLSAMKSNLWFNQGKLILNHTFTLKVIISLTTLTLTRGSMIFTPTSTKGYISFIL